MKKVVVIGCGFSGLYAAKALSRRARDISVTVIDRGPSFNFLPSLPDVIGRGIDPGVLAYPIESLSRHFGFDFIQDEVKSVDFKNNAVVTSSRTVDYDYLIIAAGSETNFYGNDAIRRSGFKLDDAKDAKKILDEVLSARFEQFVICGAGYTGIEIATNLRVRLGKMRERSAITMIEKGDQLLGPLPDWMKAYTAANLKKLDINIMFNSSVASIDNGTVVLSNQKRLDNAMLIWAAGVKTPDFVNGINLEKNRQGRVKVDPYLRISENCFVTGDSSLFTFAGAPIRMAVQFALTQGQLAARNIIRSMDGKRLLTYKPVDLGVIIPMANNRSCGIVLGIKIKGILSTFFHFSMCACRLWGFKNKSRFVWSLIKGMAIVLSFFCFCANAYALDWKTLHTRADKISADEALKNAQSTGSPDASYTLALVYLNLHKDNEADAQFQAILEKNPEVFEARWGSAEILRRRHNADKSEKILKELIKEHPDFSPSYISLAYIRYNQAKFSETIELAGKVIKQGKDRVDLSNFARAYLIIAGAKGLIAHNGGPVTKLLYGTGVFSLIKEAQKLTPGSPGVFYAMGSFYLLAPSFAGGDKAKAIVFLQKCVEADPLFTDAYVRLAQAYGVRSDKQKFSENIDKARQTDPENELLLDVTSGKCAFICLGR